MKILIDARLYGLENAGLGRYTINLVEGLKKMDRKNKYVILLRKKYFNKLKFPSTWEKRSVDIRHYSIAEQITLPKILYSEKPDVFHSPHFNVPLFYFGNMVVTIHDVLMHKVKGIETTTLPLPLYLIKRLGYKASFLKAVLASKRIIVPSKSVKNEVLERYHIGKNKIIVIYEGVDRDKFRENKGKRVNNVLRKYGLKSYEYYIYSGNAYPHKNLNILLKAVMKFKENSKGTMKLVITSSRNVFTAKLKEKIKDLKAEKYVKLLGFVPDYELVILFRNSLAFLYPSISEGFGLQGLEAISAGTLLAASDIPVFREIYKDNIFYFNPYDINSIVRTMRDISNMSKGERQRRITKGRKFIKKYSWSKMAEQTLEVYEGSNNL